MTEPYPEQAPLARPICIGDGENESVILQARRGTLAIMTAIAIIEYDADQYTTLGDVVREGLSFAAAREEFQPSWTPESSESLIRIRILLPQRTIEWIGATAQQTATNKRQVVDAALQDFAVEWANQPNARIKIENSRRRP